MLKKTLMTNILMKYNTNLHHNTDIQTIDLIAFHRHDRLTQTPIDRKENKAFPRFAFLKISKKDLLHICLPQRHWLTIMHPKELQYFNYYL